MLDEFKKFILKGNVVDLATGVIIGAAFGTIVSAFTAGIVTPLLGLMGGGATVGLKLWIFDIGLIFTGLLILVWQQFIMTDIMVLQNHGLITARVRRYVRISLIVNTCFRRT